MDGARMLDLGFPPHVRLDNEKNITSALFYIGNPLSEKTLPFIYALNASNMSNENLCMTGKLLPEHFARKIRR